MKDARWYTGRSCDRARRFGYDFLASRSDLNSQCSEFRQTAIARVVPHALPTTPDLTERLPDWLLFESGLQCGDSDADAGAVVHACII